MTVIVNIQEAQNNLSQLIQRALAGEEIIIAQAGDPVARIVPFSPQPIGRLPGSAKGRIWIAPDFDAPLPDEITLYLKGRSPLNLPCRQPPGMAAFPGRRF